MSSDVVSSAVEQQNAEHDLRNRRKFRLQTHLFSSAFF